MILNPYYLIYFHRYIQEAAFSQLLSCLSSELRYYDLENNKQNLIPYCLIGSAQRFSLIIIHGFIEMFYVFLLTF